MKQFHVEMLRPIGALFFKAHADTDALQEVTCNVAIGQMRQRLCNGQDQ